MCTYENADPLYGCISVTYVATIVYSGSLPMYYISMTKTNPLGD